MFISLSGLKERRKVDPKKYTWYVYNGKTPLKFLRLDSKELHRKHDLVINPNDMFGIYQTLTHKTYKLVVPDAMHVEFSPDAKTVQRILKASKPAKTMPGMHEVRRVSTRKQGSLYFKPRTRPTREKYQIDKSNYQWRRIDSIEEPIQLRDPNGKLRPVKLQTGQEFGLRFINKAKGKGGVIVFDKSFKTVRINTATYEALVHASQILTVQPKGIVELDSKDTNKATPKKPQDLKQTRLKRVNVRKPTIQDFDEEDEIIEVGQKSRGVRRKFTEKTAPELHDLEPDKDLDEEEEYKNQFRTKVRRRFELPSRMPKQEPESKKKVEETDEEESWDESDDFAVGDILVFNKDKKEREYIVLDKKPDKKHIGFTVYTVYDLDNKPDFLQTFKLSAKDNSTKLSKLATLVRKATRKELAKYNAKLSLKTSTQSPYA